jgi:hypothetical protein
MAAEAGRHRPAPAAPAFRGALAQRSAQEAAASRPSPRGASPLTSSSRAGSWRSTGPGASPLTSSSRAGSRRSTSPGASPAGSSSLVGVHEAGDPDARPASSGFILGLQWAGASTTTRYLPELGVTWARNTISWDWVQPTITDDTLTLEDAENDPTLVDDLIREGNWASIDAQLKPVVDAGIQLLPVIGLGWIGCLPTIDGETATPDRLGADTYLAYMYVYVRAVVERYDGDGDRDADWDRHQALADRE